MLKLKTLLTKHRRVIAGIVAISIVSLGWAAQPGLAATKQFERVLNMVGMQRMLTQKISKDLLLVALDVNRERNLRDLQSSRDLFDRTLTGLREGDVELGLFPTTDERILERLAKVDELWIVYDAALRDGLNAGEISQSQVETIAGLSTPLLKAVQDTMQAYEFDAAGKNLFSMLGVAIDLSARQLMLSQKMAKEFLLVVYGQEAERNRANLRETAALFEATLRGLVDGDAQLRLVRAPTPEIRAQLQKVERIWAQIRPALVSTAAGEEPSPQSIALVARMNVALLKTMNVAVFMYENL